MQTVYHFTARRFFRSILIRGICFGKILKSFSPLAFINGYQWVTINPDFEQSWAKGTGRLSYKRNEVRFTIQIPEGEKHRLKPWNQMRFMVPETAEDLSSFGDPENWCLFEGTICSSWIVKTDFKEGEE